MALKTRNWMFLVYPESAPKNWRQLLEETGLPFAISPLHDKDIDITEEGEFPKKPHYHVLVYYEGPTTYNNVKNNLTDLVKGTIPKRVESLKGQYEYHIHKNNPEKYQYDDRLREFINGFDKGKVNELTATQIKQIVRDLTTFIIDNDIYEYCDLISCLHNAHLYELEDVANSKTLFLSTFITSRRNKRKYSSNED